MLRYLLTTISLIFFLNVTASAQSLNDTIFITEELPPYNFVIDGKPTGFAVDILLAALNATGIKADISKVHVYPWPRAYKDVLAKPNHCLFSTVRNNAREELFKWAGPIANYDVDFIAAKDRIKANNIDDIKKSKISVIKNDIAYETILAEKFDEEQIDLSYSVISMIKKLNKGRVDIIAGNREAIFYKMGQNHINPKNYEVIFSIETAPLYFAFNKYTSDAVVRRFQIGIDKIRKEGKLDWLVRTYLPDN
ncbi:transporter substrate-binding domain-containing protein [Maridesulfovibrio sp.]|uniref:substrate-binding periplasmic protein n=1 Tax=Maridesulfovibrio sp. TaxID=2795000 RepID=UPI002A18BF60|nr:transporter substrate-binding domain-containing protein [Maridesulfovibrio sp.]